jgi:hypothetical protein
MHIVDACEDDCNVLFLLEMNTYLSSTLYTDLRARHTVSVLRSCELTQMIFLLIEGERILTLVTLLRPLKGTI